MFRTSIRTLALRLTVMAAIAGVCAMANAQSPRQGGSSGGAQEGIKVHGHWQVEVRNRDGTLASRHEFDNALDPTGRQLMAAMVAGDHMGAWEVGVMASGEFGVTHPCAAGPCFMMEPSSAHATDGNASIFLNLQVIVPRDSAGFPLGSIQLSGHVQIANTTELASVFTAREMTLGNSIIGPGFTSHALSSRIPVTAGQIVNVIMTFSFS